MSFKGEVGQNTCEFFLSIYSTQGESLKFVSWVQVLPEGEREVTSLGLLWLRAEVTLVSQKGQLLGVVGPGFQAWITSLGFTFLFLH